MIKTLTRTYYRFAHTPLRGIMTSIVEPPLDSSVPERPCTVVLAEDPGIYPSSWKGRFEDELPNKYGYSFASFQLSENVKSMDQALGEMANDFAGIPDAVLCARGPWISWMSQFYLESLPLAGLIMIDPIPLDDVNGINQFKMFYDKNGLRQSTEYRLFEEFTESWDHYSLRIEPGSIPMAVCYSFQRPAFKRTAENTALRHHDADRHEVHVNKLPIDKSNHDEEAIKFVTTWVEDAVL